MLKKIRLHNYLTGNVFTFVEYLVVVAILAPFLAYYVTHGRTLYALVATGVVLNCLTMSAVALVSLAKGEPSIGIMRLRRDAHLRKSIAEEHPNLGRLNLLLCVTLLVPYWVFLSTIVAAILGKRH